MATADSLDLGRAGRFLVDSPDPQAELARKALYYMLLMREVEDRLERKLFRQGKIVGGVYVGRGQEAICVGAGLVAEPDDVLFPCHRDMGLFFIRGVEPRRVFAQYMGRVDGVTHGKDGNMHMGDLKHNIIAFVSHLGDNVPVAAGAALTFKMRGEDRVAFCYSGEGATSRGDWHEGINFAAIHKLPVVFFINNNQYAYSTPISLQMPVENVADRAPAYGIPGDIADGNDVLSVYEAGRRAVDWARAGKGPYMVEYKTFRMTGHSAHDDAGYVPKELFEEWRQRDPIERLEQLMLEDGESSNEELARMGSEITAIVDDAVDWADKSPFPDPEDCRKGVYFEE
jgi:pyruvate dehydrogenase E1 component alpha subunit